MMIKRLAYYLNEMFPVSSFVGSLLTGITIELVYLRLFEINHYSFLPLFMPAFAITLISLLLRIMDEFKDYEDDLRNFPSRPLPSGKVKKSDLLILGILCVLGVILLSLTSKIMFIVGLFNLFFSYLMLKWFFIEARMRKSLPLALVTHHPIVFFNFVYLIFSTMEISPAINFSQAYMVLPICFIFTNWEIARKIRAPEDETSYTTYSKIMGPRKAAFVAILLQVFFIVAAFLLIKRMGVGQIGQGCFLIVQFALLSSYLSFLKTLKIKTPLKKIAELQILSIIISLFIAAVS